MSLIFKIITIIIFYLSLLLSIAFLTLLERKIMAAMQRRIGPNILGFNGLLQPFADALKLATKEVLIGQKINSALFILAPILSFFIAIVPWFFIPFSPQGPYINLDISIIFILMVSSLHVYGVLIAGWASNNKYAILGSIRTIAQMVSYEVVLSFTLMPILVNYNSANLFFIAKNSSCGDLAYYFPLFLIFCIVILAETNRAPFDLPEAEAELVAGYNVEYSSFGFALFFLGEYSSIIINCFLVVILMLGAWHLPFKFLENFLLINLITFSFKTILMSFFFVWVRATFPRIRFDYLMDLCWKKFLPLTFFFLNFYSITIFSWLHFFEF